MRHDKWKRHGGARLGRLRFRHRRQRQVAVAVERVVGAERHNMAAGQDVGQTAFHDAAGVEVVHVEKCRQRDAEHLDAIEFLSQGRVRLSTGTLYGALRRLLEDLWIERFEQEDTSREKQAYRLTSTGRRQLHAELDRMRQLTRA